MWAGDGWSQAGGASQGEKVERVGGQGIMGMGKGGKATMGWRGVAGHACGARGGQSMIGGAEQCGMA